MYKNLIYSLLLTTLMVGCASDLEHIKVSEQPSTFCNPLDLSYRFTVGGGYGREAADPTIVYHKGDYYLFASKSSGYWYSSDLASWTFVESYEIPTEDYAPTAISMRDTMFFMASSPKTKGNRVFKSADPKSGKWELTCEGINLGVTDPALYQDDDGKLYFYWGCSNRFPLYGVEMDPYTFQFIGEPKELVQSDCKNRGWEVVGDYNTEKDLEPWIEGAWMNKVNGKYYYQYSAPDARHKSYSDAVMVADSPLGEFKLAPHNAFAAKAEGFTCGAGHGSTFDDTYGNMWHAGTSSISVKNRMERRLSLFPTFVDKDGHMYIHSRFGDYPTRVPKAKMSSPADFETGWMLLSYNKAVEVSSQLEGYPAENMVNEDIRTYWCAESGSESEWAAVDLGEKYNIWAMQINFAEHDAEIRGRKKGIAHKYVVECSNNKKDWYTVDDESASINDNTNNYIELAESIKARYVRVRNVEVPGGKFTISGIRVFGLGEGEAPDAVANFKVVRDSEDRRDVTLAWDNVEGATGYNITYGVAPNMLYHNHIVYGATELTIRSLATQQPYYFTIESFNENGVSMHTEMVNAK
ncbi:MAG: family 43 glycosylhydrolase [Rikenellaceae bacterium]